MDRRLCPDDSFIRSPMPVFYPGASQKQPRVRRCRPQSCFFRRGNSAGRRCAIRPFSQRNSRPDRHPRRQRDRQMHVAFRHAPFHNRYLVPATDIPDIPDRVSYPHRREGFNLDGRGFGPWFRRRNSRRIRGSRPVSRGSPAPIDGEHCACDVIGRRRT
jgi:hypothetical protein